MPRRGQQQEVRFQNKDMAYICNVMKKAYHRGENFKLYRERMLNALDAPADRDAVPEKYRKYLIEDKTVQEQREKLTRRLREMKIEENILEGFPGRMYDTYIARIPKQLEFYLKSVGNEELFQRFKREMAEPESRYEAIARRRADGETREQAAAAVDAERRQKALERGKLITEITEAFSRTTAEMLQNRKDEEIVDSYKMLHFIHHFSTAISHYLQPDYADDYILFSEEDRQVNLHMAELYNATHEYMAQIGLVFNPYYAYLDTERMMSDMAESKDREKLEQEANGQYDVTSYFSEFEKILFEGAQAKNEQAQKEENRIARDRLAETLREHGIDPYKAQMTLAAEGTAFEIGVDGDIERFRNREEILVSYGTELLTVRQGKEDPTVCEVTYWPQTAARRVKKTLQDIGINPEQAEFTTIEGEKLSPEGEEFSYYITQENQPVLVKMGNRQVEVQVDADMKPQYRYTVDGAAAKFEETVKELGFRAVFATYYNDKNKPIDLRTEAAKEYLSSGGKITVKEGNKSAEISILERKKVSFTLNTAATQEVFEAKVRELGFSLRETVCTGADGTVLDLGEEKDLRYIGEGNPVIVTCGRKQAKILCVPGQMPEAEYTEYHKDNAEFVGLTGEAAAAGETVSRAEEDAFGNTRPDAIGEMVAHVKAADPLRLMFSGSRQYKQMKQDLTEYVRACSRLHKNDLNDPETRRQMEQLTSRLYLSARAYTKMKDNRPSGRFGVVRLAAAQEVERYAYAQLARLDKISDMQKKVRSLEERKTALEHKIAAEKPTAVRKRKEMKNPYPANLIKEENDRLMRKEFYDAGKQFCESHSPLRTNVNLEKIHIRMAQQFDEEQKGLYERCGLENTQSADKKIPAAVKETVEQFLLDTVVTDLVREEQKASGNDKKPGKAGAYEVMTEQEKTLKELERRIQDTDAFRLETEKMTRGDFRTYIQEADGAERLERLIQKIRIEMKIKLDKDLDENSDRTDNQKEVKTEVRAENIIK